MIGNFIADFVKGKKKYDYTSGIRQGIELHRKIDFYTDHHPVTGRSKDPLREKYRHYSGVIVDLYYDHFLAKNFEVYSSLDLKKYTEKTYNILRKRRLDLPPEVQYFLPYMIERNWLWNYASLEGLHRTLVGLSKRVNFENRMSEAIQDLEAGYPAFEADFSEFFPDLITFVEKETHNGAFYSNKA
jgi:acyl carrier protein phosphodiesterase